jgi:hypothetical protein
MSARRVAHFEAAMGMNRPSVSQQQAKRVPGHKGGAGSRQVVENVDEERGRGGRGGGELQWLGMGDDGMGYGRREKSEGLEQQVMNEMQRRGFDTGMGVDRMLDADGLYQGESRPHRGSSWLRSIYDRISQSGGDNDHLEEEEEGTPIPSRRRKGEYEDPRPLSEPGHTDEWVSEGLKFSAPVATAKKTPKVSRVEGYHRSEVGHVHVHPGSASSASHSHSTTRTARRERELPELPRSTDR